MIRIIALACALTLTACEAPIIAGHIAVSAVPMLFAHSRSTAEPKPTKAPDLTPKPKTPKGGRSYAG